MTVVTFDDDGKEDEAEAEAEAEEEDVVFVVLTVGRKVVEDEGVATTVLVATFVFTPGNS